MDVSFFNLVDLVDFMQQSKKYQTPHQRAWGVIRQQAAQFTTDDIAKLAKVRYRSARDYVYKLRKAGIVEITGTQVVRYHSSQARQNVYRLVKDVGYTAPMINRDGELISGMTGNRAMWNTLRITRKAFSAEELAMVSSNEEIQVAVTTARAYLSALNQAGYLCVVKSGMRNKYQLLPNMNTGANPPQIQRTKQVFDPNLNKAMFQELPALDEELKHGTLMVVQDDNN